MGVPARFRELHRAGGGGQGLGVWQAAAMPAWEFRAKRWASGCVIKGNVTANGRIYHLPWSPWYARIHMMPDKASAGFAPRPRPSPPAGGRWQRIEAGPDLISSGAHAMPKSWGTLRPLT
jgi:hypothetical protein